MGAARMTVRLLKTGRDEYAVFAAGVPAGSIRLTRRGAIRLWRADGVDGRRGVFRDKRDAARWLAAHA